MADEREGGWPSSTAMDPGSPEAPVAVSWNRTWDTAEEHRKFAAAHRSEAGALQAAYDEACGERPLAQVSISPLMRHGIGGSNTETGVVVYLASTAGSPDQLLADLRCHRAWMMLAPAGMDDCPLDLPGLVADARADSSGTTLTLTVKNAKLIPELQRRVAHDLEAHARMER